jgi:ATP-dependent Lon protease
MKLSNYGDFPADIPVIAEDELFLYPFMISPLFLSDENNINAATIAMEDSSLVIVCPTKPSRTGERTYDALYDAGVVGSIMRKVALPDGRVKVLFQGLARAKTLYEVQDSPLIAKVEILEATNVESLKIEAILEVVPEKHSIAPALSLLRPLNCKSSFTAKYSTILSFGFSSEKWSSFN